MISFRISMRFCGFTDRGLVYIAKAIGNGTLVRAFLWQGTSISGEGSKVINQQAPHKPGTQNGSGEAAVILLKAFGKLAHCSRLAELNTDSKFYEVDGLWHMAENGHGGLRKWDTFTPKFGEYSHQACYEGKVEASPGLYWTPSSQKV